MNRERLQMVRDKIASEPPERLNMSKVHCGTAHCIAGWAQVEGGLELSDSMSNAGGWLGLEIEQRKELFKPPRWLIRNAYTRDDALAALDSLINADSDDALPVWPKPRA